MKKLFLLLILVVATSVQASQCDEDTVSSKIEVHLNALVGESAGGSDKILKVENIDILTTEDESGNVKALFSFDETIGDRASTYLFKMKGYAVIRKSDCKQIDGLMLGSTPVL